MEMTDIFGPYLKELSMPATPQENVLVLVLSQSLSKLGIMNMACAAKIPSIKKSHNVT